MMEKIRCKVGDQALGRRGNVRDAGRGEQE